jgi:PAS domain S-box-containing protein
MQRLVAGEIGAYQMEKRYLHKHGQVVWGHLSGAVVRDEFGSPLHFIGQLENITARKQAERAVQESEERFRTAFEEAAIGMSLVDLDGHYLRVNAALCELTGYSEVELLATTFQGITHPDDREMDRAQLELLFAGEIPAFQREKRYLRNDGTAVWVRVNSST